MEHHCNLWDGILGLAILMPKLYIKNNFVKLHYDSEALGTYDRVGMLAAMWSLDTASPL